jgi:hypothetical protein
VSDAELIAERILRERRIDERFGRIIDIVQRGVLRHTDNLHPVLVVELQPSLQGIASAEEFLRARLVDDGDRRRGCRIGIKERTAAEDPRARCLEVPGRDGRAVGVHILPRRRPISFDRHAHAP